MRRYLACSSYAKVMHRELAITRTLRYDASTRDWIMRNCSLMSLPLSCTVFNFYWLEVNRSINAYHCRSGQREFSLHSVDNLSSSRVAVKEIDNSVPTLIPFYDRDSNVVIATGKVRLMKSIPSFLLHNLSWLCRWPFHYSLFIILYHFIIASVIGVNQHYPCIQVINHSWYK